MLFSKHKKNKLIRSNKLPEHVALIMDGNGRWAKQRGLPRNYGHNKGLDTLRTIVRECNELGIKYLSAYAFSTENWKRPESEVNYLMDLLKKAISRDAMDLKAQQVKINFIGDRAPFTEDIKKLMEQAERQIDDSSATAFLNLMVNYGSRQEIIQATNRAVAGGKPISSEEEFSELLYTAGIPDPDLLIRTSGEVRVSNYLLWQISYAELYFTRTLWPDFKAKEFQQALLYYIRRDRRKGGL